MSRAALLSRFVTLVLMFVCSGSLLSQDASASFHVTGVVLSEGTNVPVVRCHLSIRPEGRQSGRRGTAATSDVHSADTDSQGRFSFDLPTQGRWQLSASAAGYRTQFYNEHEEFSSAIVLRSGFPSPTLVLHLEADSSLSGFVRDEAAEPVRNAVLTLQVAKPLLGIVGRRQRATTDDRGHFEITGIAPGIYKLSVQATPWYTTGNGSRSGVAEPGQARSGDSVFDVIYPTTWYPGVLESEAAGEISLHGGDAAQIDFNLLPLSAAHLRIAEPAGTSTNPTRLPTVERVDGGPRTGGSSQVTSASGQVDFGSLAPGLYRVTMPQADGHQTTSFIHVAAGATLALGAADPTSTTDVSIRVAGEERASRTQVNFTDVSSGAVFTSFSGDDIGLRRRPSSEAERSDKAPEQDRHIAIPPGRYQVTLAGDPDLYLTSVEVKQKPIAGRVISLSGGSTTLTVNVARGRGTVAGHVILSGKPNEGAMVMLVPTSFGRPDAIDLLRRDQSNTDGSFDLTEVIPGDYILLAIDHGWSVNWHDLATLDRYLLHGTPISLKAHSSLEQEIQAQAP